MTQSRSYPVTKDANPPQPHVEFDDKPTKYTCSGWLYFVLAGALACSFMIGVFVYGGNKLFLSSKDPYEGLVPIKKQGYLQVYPFTAGISKGIETKYSTHLPPRNLTKTIAALSELLESYPKTHSSSYKNCWLENPTASTPCFYDSSWIADVCQVSNKFGYEVNNGTFSPCFILRFEKTGDWKPLPGDLGSIPSSISDDFDHGFMPVHCYGKSVNSSFRVTVYPSKGFSLLFFPVSRFHPQVYLAPLVAVKVNNIPKGQNVTVKCFAMSRAIIERVIESYSQLKQSPLFRKLGPHFIDPGGIQKGKSAFPNLETELGSIAWQRDEQPLHHFFKGNYTKCLPVMEQWKNSDQTNFKCFVLTFNRQGNMRKGLPN